MIIGIQMIAVSEGSVLGERLGIDPKMLQKILSASSSGCWATRAANPRPGNIEGSPASNGYQGGLETAKMIEDLNLALECFENKPEMTLAAKDYYSTLDKAGHGSKDIGNVF